MHGAVVARKGAHEHYKRALGQVEVGDKAVDALKFIAGVDEDIRPAVVLAYAASESRHGFKGAAAGGADGEYPASARLSLVDYRGGLGGQVVVLRVHMMLLDVIRLDGAEGAEADMERDETYPDAFFFDLFKQLGCEMQTRRGRCGAALLLGVDGLVSVLILESLGDIMRQGHLAYPVNYLKEIALKAEFRHSVAVGQHFDYLGGQRAVAECEAVTLFCLFAGAGYDLPGVGGALS